MKNDSVKFRQPLVAIVSETDLLPKYATAQLYIYIYAHLGVHI